MEAGVGAPYLFRRSTHRALQQVSDLFLQDAVGRQSDRVSYAFGFEELIDLGVGEGRIAAEIEPLHRAPVTGDHRLQHFPPAISRMDVTGAQGTPLQIAQLVEHKQRMVAGTAEMAVVGASFLGTVSRALARIHIEHDDTRPTPLVHRVDPLPRQIGDGGEVLRSSQPLGLEAAHLAGRSSLTRWCPAANHPTHRRIAAQPPGVVHVLVAGQPPEYRLPQQPNQEVPSVFAGACLRQSLAAACGQSEHVVQFAIGQ